MPERIWIRGGGGNNVYAQSLTLAERKRAAAERENIQRERLDFEREKAAQTQSLGERRLQEAQYYHDAQQDLQNKALKLEELRTQAQLAQEDLKMETEAAKIDTTRLQATQLTGALREVSKLDPDDVNFTSKLTEVYAKYPALAQESNNGFEKEFQKIVAYKQGIHEKGREAAIKLASEWGVDPVYNQETGRFDFNATREAFNARRLQEQGETRKRDMEFAGEQGLAVTGAEQTSSGTQLRFGSTSAVAEKNLKDKYGIGQSELMAPDTKVEAGTFAGQSFKNDPSGSWFKVTATKPSGDQVSTFIPKNEYDTFKSSFTQTTPAGTTTESVTETVPERKPLDSIFGGN
jgi:hypothetical protein